MQPPRGNSAKMTSPKPITHARTTWKFNLERAQNSTTYVEVAKRSGFNIGHKKCPSNATGVPCTLHLVSETQRSHEYPMKQSTKQTLHRDRAIVSANQYISY